MRLFLAAAASKAARAALRVSTARRGVTARVAGRSLLAGAGGCGKRGGGAALNWLLRLARCLSAACLASSSATAYRHKISVSIPHRHS